MIETLLSALFGLILVAGIALVAAVAVFILSAVAVLVHAGWKELRK